MYNKKFNGYVKKVDAKKSKPKKEGEEPKTEISVTLWVNTNDMKFFDDMNFAGKRSGLDHILSGAVPIQRGVELEFVDPGMMEMNIGELKELATVFVHVKTGALDSQGMIAAEVCVKVLEFSEEEGGALLLYLGSLQEVKLIKMQEELPLE